MSQNEYLPFSKPTIDQATIDEVIACLKSGWIATGPRVQRFETQLKEYLHAPHALALVSATAGLHLSMYALNLQPSDEVITTSMTFVASLNTIAIAGGKPVLVDIEPTTYNIDVNRIADAITPRTRAITPVHFAGLPVDLDPLYKLAKQHGLRVIEDAAQAIGTRYKNKLIGSFGDTQVFSFHPTKGITTGEGGCVTTHDDELARVVKIMRFHGIDRDAFNRFAKEGSQHYDVVMPGLKYNMLDLQAALGIHQMEQIENFIEKRIQLAERYNTLLADWPEWQLPGTPAYDHRHSWHIYTPLIQPEVAGIDRDTFIQKMKENNIGIGLHYTAPHLYSYYQKQFAYRKGDFPHAESVGERIVSLPLFPQMTFDDQDRVIETMAKIFGKKL